MSQQSSVSAQPTFHVYTFSYNNPTRAAKMRTRFNTVGLPLTFVDVVNNDDPRLAGLAPGVDRIHAIMWNHLDMLKTFLESDHDFGVFCEDDILIRKDFAILMPEVMAVYNRLDLEILLLGYLVPYKPVDRYIHPNFSQLGVNLSYLSYTDDQWGAQMYMLDRKTAQNFCDKYTLEYARKSLTDASMRCFNPDWTLTKDGRRSAVYPMLALEEGASITGAPSHVTFHYNCFKAHDISGYI